MPPRRSARTKAPANYKDPPAPAEDESELSSVEDTDDAGVDSDKEEEYVAKKPTPKKRAKKPAAPKKGGGGGRKKKAVIGGVDLRIESDNQLWNAVASTNASINSVVEDWVSSFQSEEDEEGEAMSVLINFVLRCCGCNGVVDRYEAIDVDGIVDKLDDIQTAHMAAPDLGYPLIHKKPPLSKVLRPNLTEFFNTLLETLHSTDLLHTTQFIDTFSPWLVSLSSSRLRSFRHTSTFLALLFVQALCSVGEEVGGELRKASVARENEQKRLEGMRGKKDKGRLREFEKRAEEADQRKEKIEEACKDIFHGIFIHRYHDTDPLVRLDCIASLGVWMETYPSYWIDGAYLRYFGWLLSDVSPLVRLAAIQALEKVYSQTDYVGLLQHFTERFKGQIVDMAVGEVDSSVRIAALSVLDKIDGLGMLEDEQRDQVAVLVFEKDKGVRDGASRCWARLVREEVEERKVGLEASGNSPRKGKRKEERVTRLAFKCIALLLSKYSTELDKKLEDADPNIELPYATKGRIALAVDSLWEADGLDVLHDWESLLLYLQADHSSSTEEALSPSKRKKVPDEDPVEEGCKLDEEEEGIMIEALVAVLEKTLSEKKKGKDKQAEEETRNDITRALMTSFLRLLEKHKTFESRVAELLLLPHLMNLELYLDMRLISSYEQLWDHLTSHFLRHTELMVLQRAVHLIRRLMSTSSLSATNEVKIVELEELLLRSFRNNLDGHGEIATAQFEEDEVQSLEATVRRVNIFQKVRDLSDALESGVEGQRASLWECLDALAERGRLGYREEEEIVKESLGVLTVHLVWKLRNLKLKEDLDENDVDGFLGARNSLLERLREYTLETSSNVVDSVKRTAFIHLMTVYTLLSPSTSPERLSCDCGEETQAKAAEFVKSEIDKVVEEMPTVEEEEEEEGDTGGEGDGDGEEGEEKKKPKKDTKEKRSQSGMKKLNTLKIEYLLNEVISSFVKAIQLGVISISHSVTLFPYYHILHSGFYDQCCKFLADDMKEGALYGGTQRETAQIIVQSFKVVFDDLYLEGKVKEEKDILQLSKLFGSSIVLRGPNLSISKKLQTESFLYIHTKMMTWAIQKITDLDKEDELFAMPGTIRVNKKKRDVRRNKIASAVFKSLLHLVTGMTGKEALTLKSLLDSHVTEKGLEISKGYFEALRVYEKRLIGIMTKDKTIKSALAKRRAAESDLEGEPSTDGEGETSAIDPFAAADNLDATMKAERAKEKKDRPRQKTQKRKRDADENGDVDDRVPPKKKKKPAKAKNARKKNPVDDNGEPLERRKSSRQRQEKSYREVAEEEQEEEEQEEEEQRESSLSEPEPSPEPEPVSVVRKRKRKAIEEDEEREGGVERLRDLTNGTSNGVPEKPISQSSNVSLSDIKRKRRKKK